MTAPNERSDPVDGHTDVTPEQLDALHAKCIDWTCKGPQRARERAKLDRAVTANVDSLGRITAAMGELGETLRTINSNPWGRVVIARESRTSTGQTLEPLADWERELLAGVEAERSVRSAYVEALQAGLQHQRIGNAGF